MKEANILGISQDTIAVIFDVLAEERGVEHFNVFPNIAIDIEPFLPVKKVSFQIKNIGEIPDPNETVFFGLATPKNKESVFSYFLENYKIEKNRYQKIIHPTAYIANSTTVEKGVLIEPNVVVGSQSTIGFGVFIKRGSLVGHHNIIGDFTDINPGVVLSGKITIGRGCTIGSGTVIKDNITIGDNTIIGVGSVVTKDIPANSIAYGNPCKVMKENK